MRTVGEHSQSLVTSGLGRLSAASLTLVRFTREESARGELASLAPALRFGALPKPCTRALQLAITPRGFERLGLPRAVFPYAFRDPLASEHHRRVLGDEGESAPETWAWNGDEADLCLLLYANSVDGLRELEAESCAPFEEVARLQTLLLDDRREHFGFRDGLSSMRLGQPGEEGRTAVGEIVLGHPDATGAPSASPCVEGLDLGRDGSYLVLRQLAQDVPAFWGRLRELDPDPVRLSAKLMGRWPDGELLTGSASFTRDAHGLQCPRGAHVRRANPQGPEATRHRLLRRGRPYGPPAPPEVYPPGLAVSAGATAPSASAERGLLFACLCADLARQFEHVQQSWLNNAKHDGLFDEICPISSAVGAVGDARRFTIPQYPTRRRLERWPRVVRVRGAAYGLLVGRAAFEALCQGSWQS